MVGIIHRREQVKSSPEPPFNPDDIFDPTTHIATEENFMKLLDHGVYDSKYIGYKVQLSNSVDYNNGLWVIADVDHDSANTGQSNCYDLISEECYYSTTFASSGNSWRNSTPRTWLNNTFYPGFSTEFKNHVLNLKYNSHGTWYTDDYVILPSYKEVNGGTSAYQDNEGVKYPIFTNNTSRIKYQSGTSTARSWWTRSGFATGSSVWYVDSDGYMNNSSYYSGNSNYLAPLLRVS